jgi:D-beta-D-heptose 7-phosphate kinase / D-beta-D-heptose 1-phosphate adenosyltransferase
LHILAALEAVDFVTLFTHDHLADLLKDLKPDILAKGSNYPKEQVDGREIVTAYGGQVVLVSVTEPLSIADLIQRIRHGIGETEMVINPDRPEIQPSIL